jgi:hypothetical protein
MCGATPPLPQYVFMVWYLVKHRDYFTLTKTAKKEPPQQSLTEVMKTTHYRIRKREREKKIFQRKQERVEKQVKILLVCTISKKILKNYLQSAGITCHRLCSLMFTSKS